MVSVVKVIISTSFGAGWSTWDREYPESAYHPLIIKAIEQKLPAEDIEELAEKLWPEGYWSADTLCIEEIPDGKLFKITEYDGAESVEIVSVDAGFILADSKLNTIPDSYYEQAFEDAWACVHNNLVNETCGKK